MSEFKVYPKLQKIIRDLTHWATITIEHIPADRQPYQVVIVSDVTNSQIGLEQPKGHTFRPPVVRRYPFTIQAEAETFAEKEFNLHTNDGFVPASGKPVWP